MLTEKGGRSVRLIAENISFRYGGTDKRSACAGKSAVARGSVPEGKQSSKAEEKENGAPWILKNVSLEVNSGESVALTAPSGYGKSTLAKILAGYLQPQEGQVLLDGKPLSRKGYNPVQLIYQHPEQAVNPRLKMDKMLNEAWAPGDALLAAMGIEKEWLSRFPSELSGGELQRFCIARALGPQTRFLICDEITTMLDVITQAQIWDVILKNARSRGMGLVVVTHNMALADRICDRIVRLEDCQYAD